MRAYILYFSIIVAMLNSNLCCKAQLYNGTSLYITNGLTLTIENGLVNESTGEISNDGTVNLKQSWENHNPSGGMDNTMGFVEIDDAVVTIGGTEPTTFNNVSITAGSEMELSTNNAGSIGCSINGTLSIGAGTLDLNERIIAISNSSTTAISNTSGYIFDNNNAGAVSPYSNLGVVRWHVGSNIGTYVVPFGEPSGDDVPVKLIVSNGGDPSGYIDVSTYETAFDNIPTPDLPLVTNLDLAGTNNSDEMVNRFWRIDASSYSSQPVYSIDFGFTFNNTCIGPTCPSQIDQNKLAAYRWDVSSSAWDLNLLDGSVTTSATSGNSGVYSSVDVGTGDSWWVLADRCAGFLVEVPSAILNMCSTNQLDVNVSGGTGSLNYTWSPADSLSSTTIQNPTTNVNYDITYTIDVTDQAGCSGSDQVSVDVAAIPQDICLVTVDTNSVNNIVVWEKPITTAIDSFRVYRVTTALLDSLIGTVAYDSLSQFEDIWANPNVSSYQYKVSSVDTCGTESPLSALHKTIHLTVSQGLPGTVNANWNDYIGEPVNFYELWCDSTGLGGSNWYVVSNGGGTIAPGTNSFVDVNAPTDLTNTTYRLQTNWLLTCVSTRANHNTTRSNRLQPQATPPNGAGDDFVWDDLLLYPNPVKNFLFLEFRNSDIIGSNYEIIDKLGRIVHHGAIDDTNVQINVDFMSNGAYTLRLNYGQSIITQRFIVQ